MARRRIVKRSEAEWRRLIATQRQSGKTQEEYCRETGLAKTTFWKWTQRLKRAGLPKFVELNPAIGGISDKPAKVEVEVAGGITLRIWS